MPEPLLQTKLYIPPLRPGYVPRPRLTGRLNDGLSKGRALTLISAPAGYGKTTVLVEWLRARRPAAAWISLDETDDEPARFFTYFLAAIQSVNSAVGLTLDRRLQGPKLPSLIPLMTALINDIVLEAGGRPGGDDPALILLLDDFHTISSAVIHEGIDFLLERQPPQMHLVIATRQDPPLALSRLRARDRLTELRQNDLRLSREESAAFLIESMGLDPSPAEIESLKQRSEGWVAGLQLAALSMQGLDAAERARFIAAFSGRTHFILDYLTDEVLRRQPAHVQHFLLHTAVLEQMCGPLCDRVLGLGEEPGRPDSDKADWITPTSSGAILEELERINLFVVPMDDERRWYRYHHLFAELLGARLAQTRPEIVPLLHRRAAAWYEENRFMARAVRHALSAGDMALAADVIEKAIKHFATWSSVEISAMLAWLQALPAAVLAGRPWLRLYESRGLYISGQFDLARERLRALETWLESHPDAPEAEKVGGFVRADRASDAVVRGDLAESMAYARSALAHLPEDDTVGRMRATSILGLSQLRAGEVGPAHKWFSEAVNLVFKMGMPVAAVPLVCNLAEVLIIQGRLQEAAASCQQALELGTVEGKRITSTGFASLELGKIAYERNDLEAAERHLNEALEYLSRGGITESFGGAHALLALVKQAQGRTDEAQAAVEQAIHTAQQGRIERLITEALAYRARIWLAQGSVGLAVRWARDYRRLDPMPYLREFEELTLARVLLASARAEEALSLLDGLLGPAQTTGRLGRVVEIAALRALAIQAQGDAAGALDALKSALELAEPEGYRRLFLNEGQPMADLLLEAGKKGISPEVVLQLLAAFEREAQASESGRSGTAARPLTVRPSILVEPLTERELQILRLLAEGLSNREIGERLYLSPHTVRTHTYNLYGKLGVHSRTQAVAKGRKLKLLSSG